MEQNALAVSRGFSKNPIYTESCRCYETYRFYRFTDLRICTTFAAPGPTRARARSTTRSVAARRERCIISFPRARTREEWRGGDTVVKRGGEACEIRCSGAGLRSCWGRGECVAPVVQECRQLVGALQACGVVGRRGHAHARMQKVKLTLEQKVLIFGANSGCTARIRKAWRWHGSAGSSAYSDVGVAVARERGITSSWECRVVDSQQRGVAFPDSHWPIKHVE